MTALNEPQRRPVAVYTAIDDTDLSAGVELLQSAGVDVRMLHSSDPEQIVAGAQDADALLVGYAAITADVIQALPKLKIVALMSMGVNNVDLEAAADQGVWVTNILGVATEEVATHTVALMLDQLRGVSQYRAAVHEGRWNDRTETAQPRLSTMTLGLVGLGRIGLKVAELARPFFGRIVAYDPHLAETAEVHASLHRAGVERVSLEELKRSSQVVSLHVPLTAATHHLVDDAFLSGMPPQSYLFNVSRGALVDSQALRDAIDRGHIAGAGLDVLDIEPPPPDHPLVGHDRVTVTPHIGYYSDVTEVEYVRAQAQNVVSLFKRGTPETPVPGSGPSTHLSA